MCYKNVLLTFCFLKCLNSKQSIYSRQKVWISWDFSQQKSIKHPMSNFYILPKIQFYQLQLSSDIKNIHNTIRDISWTNFRSILTPRKKSNKLYFLKILKICFDCNLHQLLSTNGRHLKTSFPNEKPKADFVKAHFLNTSDMAKCSAKRKTKQKGIDFKIVFVQGKTINCVTVYYETQLTTISNKNAQIQKLMLTPLRYTPSDTKIIKNKVFPQKMWICGKIYFERFFNYFPFGRKIWYIYFALSHVISGPLFSIFNGHICNPKVYSEAWGLKGT